MKACKTLFLLAVFGLSVGVSANEGKTYVCDSLDNPYANYSIHVEDGLVFLRTVHGSDRGLHSTTNTVMHHIDSTNNSEVFRGAGITATFVANIMGRKVHKSLTISDRHGHVASCH